MLCRVVLGLLAFNWGKIAVNLNINKKNITHSVNNRAYATNHSTLKQDLKKI